MKTLFIIVIAISVTALNTAIAQERPGRPKGRPGRPERGPDDMREPEMKQRLRERMDRTMQEIEELQRRAEELRKHGQKEELEKVLHEIRRLEEILRELERQGHFPGPNDIPPEPPRMNPEKIEKIHRNLKRIEQEIQKARENGNEKQAKNLEREAEDIRRSLESHREAHPPRPEFTEEDIDKVIEWLKENEPKTLEKLSALRQHEPDAYYHFLRELFEKMLHMEEMKKRDPEGYARMIETRKLDKKIWLLVDKYRNIESDEEKKEIESTLKDTLSKLFDLKQAQHKAEIAGLENEVAKLKEIYQKNQENKETILQERLKELTGKKRKFDW